MMKMLVGVAGLVLLCGAAPAAADNPAPQSGNAAGKNTDPNRIICEKVQETGSRLNTRKTCMTAAQWAEQRIRDRQAVEEAQRQQTEPSGR